MLDKILDTLLKSLENGNWLVVILVVAIAVVVNLRAILEFFERRGTRREEFVKDALKIDVVRDAARSVLEEELNYLVFKRVTGISADRALREKIKSLVDRSDGELQTFQFARARKHTTMKDGKLLIRITRSDKIEHLFNWSFAVLVAVFALLAFMLPTTVKGASFQQVAIFIGLGTLMFFFALFLVSQTTPITVAKHIKPIVERLEAIPPQDED
ncbi:hypothetical protein [Azonexus sp.]|uniref:hypothetical protein n=1 Tax=Azonexus sp. TaxID=1872668 RepID=UPI0035AEC036